MPGSVFFAGFAEYACIDHKSKVYVYTGLFQLSGSPPFQACSSSLCGLTDTN